MLRAFRENIKGRFGKVLLAVIIVPFVLFGAESLLTGGNRAAKVLEVNGEVIDEPSLAQEIVILRNETASRMGENVDYEQLSDTKLYPLALERLTQKVLLDQSAKELKMVAADALMRQAIVSNPGFQVDGQFSSEQMNSVLASRGFNLNMIKSRLENDIIAGQFSSGVAASGFSSEKEADFLVNVVNESRIIDWAKLDIQRLKSNVNVSDEEVRELYSENNSDYMTELLVDAEYILIDLDKLKLPVEDAQVAKEYDLQKSQFVASERRQVSHILFEVNESQNDEEALARALDIKQRLDNGESFNELANSYSQDSGSASEGGDLGYTEEDGTFPEAFEKAVFSLGKNEVSEPVVTDAGIHLIKVGDVEPVEIQSFEELRPAIVELLEKRAAKKEYIELTSQLKDMAFNAEDLREPAETLELEVMSVSFIGRNGVVSASETADKARDVLLFSDSRLTEALFDDEVLNERLNSELIELSPEKSIIVRVSNVYEPRLQSLDEVRSVVTEKAIAQKAQKQMLDIIERVKESAAQSSDFAAALKSEDLEVVANVSVSRQSTELDAFALEQVFGASRSSVDKEIHSAVSDEGVAYIFELKEIKSGKDSASPDLQKLFMRQVANLNARQDIAAFLSSLKQSATIE